MITMSEKQLVPKLRFAGFNESWKKHDLMEVINEFYNGQTPSRSNLSYWNGNIPWTSVSDLNYGFVTDTLEKITDLGKESANLKILPKDTFIIAIVGLEAKGTRGSCALLGIDSTINQACLALIPNKNKLDQSFMVQWYLYVGEQYGIKYTQGTKQQNYNIDLLKKLPIIMPISIKEQCKIGSFLFKIDEKIRLLQEKQDYYQNFKKYLMQQIFAQKLRFDSNGLPINELNKQIKTNLLGNLCTIRTGKLDANAMDENGQYRFYTCSKEFSRINTYAFDTEALLIAGNGEVGHIQYYNGKFNAYQRTYVLDNFNKDTSIKYVKYFLERYLPKQIWKNKQTGSMPYIVLSTLSDMKISYPSINEQNKIVTLFSNIDEKIELMEKELNEINNFKKGLLQQMFV